MTRIAARLALACASAGAAIILAEVTVRVFAVASPPVAVSVDERGFADLVGVFVPAPAAVDRRNRSLPHSVMVNALGFRGAEVPRAKPAAERRILMLGDSFVWGDFVNDGETIPSHLELDLRPSCANTRVLNLGVGGTSIDAQQSMLARGLALAPDLVILMFHDNDVEDLRRPTYWERMAANRAAKSRFPMSVVYRLVRSSALWVVARQGIERLRAASASPSSGPQAAAPSDTAELRNAYRTGLGTFMSAVAAAGLPLMVSGFPSHLALRDPAATEFAWLDQLMRQASAPYVDLRAALLASGKGASELYLLPHDGHATPVGNRLASAAIARVLLASPDADRFCEPRSRTGSDNR